MARIRSSDLQILEGFFCPHVGQLSEEDTSELLYGDSTNSQRETWSPEHISLAAGFQTATKDGSNLDARTKEAHTTLPLQSKRVRDRLLIRISLFTV
jgi:hypothetical protein